MNTPLRLVGFSKKKDKEITMILFDGSVWSVIDDVRYFFEPDTIVQLREYNSGVLVDELKLKDLFNKPKK